MSAPDFRAGMGAFELRDFDAWQGARDAATAASNAVDEQHAEAPPHEAIMAEAHR